MRKLWPSGNSNATSICVASYDSSFNLSFSLFLHLLQASVFNLLSFLASSYCNWRWVFFSTGFIFAVLPGEKSITCIADTSSWIGEYNSYASPVYVHLDPITKEWSKSSWKKKSISCACRKDERSTYKLGHLQKKKTNRGCILKASAIWKKQLILSVLLFLGIRKYFSIDGVFKKIEVC